MVMLIHRYGREMISDNNSKNNKRGRVVIRRMEIDDVSQVYHLGEELFTSDEFPVLYRTWDASEVTDYFSSDPEYCLVAEFEDRIVGFILGTIVEKDGTAWKKYGYLTWIGVEEEFQRKNLGFRLYRRLEEKYIEAGVRMIIADTEADNKKAIAFFKNAGFSQTSRYIWLAKTLHRPAKKRSIKKLPETPPDGQLSTSE